METNQEKIIRSCLNSNNSSNVIIGHANHVVIHTDDNRILYDMPTSINTTIYHDSKDRNPITKSSKYIDIHPINIEYIISRDNFENAGDDSTFKYHMEDIVSSFYHKLQEYLLYGNTYIDGLLSNNKSHVIECHDDISSQDLEKHMMEMKNYMIQNNYLNNSVWLISAHMYQLLNQGKELIKQDGKWIEHFYGLPIFVCHELKANDLCVLVNLQKSYCVVTKPKYNVINIDNNIAKNGDAYIIDLTIYSGGKLLNEKSMCILRTTS